MELLTTRTNTERFPVLFHLDANMLLRQSLRHICAKSLCLPIVAGVNV